jgi:hypothetical protein
MQNTNTMSVALLTAKAATGAGTTVSGRRGVKTYQASGTTTAGAGAATVVIQGSNDDANWDTIGTVSLTLATTTSSGSFTSDDRYTYLRGNVTAISGTGAAVNASFGF